LDPIVKHIENAIYTLTQENLVLQKWISPDGSPLCVVCGLPIQNVSSQRLSRPMLWHSKKCYKYKSKKIIVLEQQYGCDIVDILKKTTRMYGSIKAQCDALGISVPYFYLIIRKFCDKDIQQFMIENSVGDRHQHYIRKFNSLNSNNS
jgi:hypothetical protein